MENAPDSPPGDFRSESGGSAAPGDSSLSTIPRFSHPTPGLSADPDPVGNAANALSERVESNGPTSSRSAEADAAANSSLTSVPYGWPGYVYRGEATGRALELVSPFPTADELEAAFTTEAEAVVAGVIVFPPACFPGPKMFNERAFSRLFWPIFLPEADIKVYEPDEDEPPEHFAENSPWHAPKFNPSKLRPFIDNNQRHPIAAEPAADPPMPRMVVDIESIDAYEWDLDSDPRPEPLVMERNDGGPVTIGDFITAVRLYFWQNRNLVWEVEGGMGPITGEQRKGHFYFETLRYSEEKPDPDFKSEDSPARWRIWAERYPQRFTVFTIFDEGAAQQDSGTAPGSTLGTAPGRGVITVPVYRAP
ncbi:hypothetical protein EJ06DRAFT_270890 [Trichodelitschia bisporula]|uniref:Uncharacterized protein n=1 Tax=Trichodelitschia bisporula TaxID=703511 RepID=A0A6G1HI41_9PEZI|nr:hypothetical protein EJ06DRAFT_270890 [Trichodelitschia bisporula]